jgi:O-antigen biosynthesis protein
MSASTPIPALVALFQPENLSVLVAYLEAQGPRVVITSRRALSLPQKNRLQDAGARVIFIENTLSEPRKAQLVEPRRVWMEKMAEVINGPQTSAKMDRIARKSLIDGVRDGLPVAIEWIAALDELASEHPIELVLLNERPDTRAQTLAVWAQSKALPCVYVQDRVLWPLPDPVALYRRATHIAVAGPKEAALLSGLPVIQTGLPALEALVAQKEQATSRRASLCLSQKLDGEKPLVLYILDAARGESITEDPGLAESLMQAYIEVIQTLGDSVHHLIEPHALSAASLQAQRFEALAQKAGVARTSYRFIQRLGIALGNERQSEFQSLPAALHGADLVVAPEHPALVWAAILGKKRIQLVTHHRAAYPERIADAVAALRCGPSELASEVMTALMDTEPAQACPPIAGAQARLVAVMQEAALKEPRKILFENDPLLRRKAPPPAWAHLGEESGLRALVGFETRLRPVDAELLKLTSDTPMRRVLQVGNTHSDLAQSLKKTHPGVKVFGLVADRTEARLANRFLDRLITGRLDTLDFEKEGIEKGSLDAVFFPGTLENQINPWKALQALRPWLSGHGQLFIRSANPRHLKRLEAFSQGYCAYEVAGPLNVQQLRFFPERELRRLLHQAGYHVAQRICHIDPELGGFYEENKGKAGLLDLRFGALSLHRLPGEEIDELCSDYFLFQVLQNAIPADVENYRRQSAYAETLEALRLKPWEGRLWDQHLDRWPSLPRVRLVLLDPQGHVPAVSRTIQSLSRLLYGHTSVSVVSRLPAPKDFSASERLDWHHSRNVKCLFDTVNELWPSWDTEWLGFVFAGDRLEAATLLHLMEKARSSPSALCLYTDHDLQGADDVPDMPQFKPDFDLEWLLAHDYLSNGLMLIRRDALETVGAFDPALRGAELLDWSLRLAAMAPEEPVFAHVPQPLLHRPFHGNDHDLPFGPLREARRKAIERHFEQTGQMAGVRDGWLPGSFRILRKADPSISVSILLVLDAQTQKLGERVEHLLAHVQNGPAFELLLLDNGLEDAESRAMLEGLDAMNQPSLRVFRLDPPASPVQARNLLAEQAQGDVLLFSEDVWRWSQPDALTEWLGYFSAPTTAAVAARVLSPEGAVRHSGLIVGTDSIATDAFKGLHHSDTGPIGRAHLPQTFSALPPAALLVRSDVFHAAHGLDIGLSESLDVAFTDLTLRLSEANLCCLWTPFVSLIHEPAWQKAECVRGSDDDKPAEKAPKATPVDSAEQSDDESAVTTPKSPYPDEFVQRHMARLARDPAYSPMLSSAPPLFVLEPRENLLSDRLPWKPLPRILATQADKTGCGHYRISEPARALRENWKAQAVETAFVHDAIDVARFGADTLVFQRQAEPDQIERIARIRRITKRPMCFELDDLMFDLTEHNPHRAHVRKDIKERLREGIAQCDRLVVSTEGLAEAMRDMHTDIRVVPNYLNADRWEGLAPKRRDGRKPRVGWSGSVSHRGDLIMIEDVVKSLAKEVDWVFMGLATDGIRACLAEYHPGVPVDQYPEKLAEMDLDLAIAPLEYHPFNECKTNLKLLEYGILGYPVLATDISTYQGTLPVSLVKNGTEHWVEAIRERVSDPDALHAQGQALRQAILKDWMIEDHLDEWLSAWLTY